MNLCNQKYLGEKCQLQFSHLGPVYFSDMPVMNKLNGLNDTEQKCLDSNINPPFEYINQCQCPVECETNQYDFSSSSQKFNHPNVTRLVIFYNEMKETVMSEQPKTTLSDLISTIGGILGLFTGFSFLSLVELLEIIDKIAFILIRFRRVARDEKNNQEIITAF